MSRRSPKEPPKPPNSTTKIPEEEKHEDPERPLKKLCPQSPHHRFGYRPEDKHADGIENQLGKGELIRQERGSGNSISSDGTARYSGEGVKPKLENEDPTPKAYRLVPDLHPLAAPAGLQSFGNA
jgi:hypothetical protein